MALVGSLDQFEGGFLKWGLTIRIRFFHKRLQLGFLTFCSFRVQGMGYRV